MMFDASVSLNGETQRLENTRREDIQTWIKLVYPDPLANVDWEKLEKGDVIEVNNSLIIRTRQENQQPDTLPEETATSQSEPTLE